MTFTSYAQNFEDVILWRALKHIKNGFYIDVGAQDPVVDSVSLGFYRNGWRGIHAEATSYYAEKIRLARPDEQVTQSAIGSGQGTITFFEIPESGLSTSNRNIAMKHESEGRSVTETTVSLLPLSQLLDAAGQKDVHWLKIDVEGMEASVIGSWASSAVRPWIVVVESTRPNSQEPSFEDWEPTLLNKGYKFAYFDGLSRYYVSNFHPELLDYFGPGPNVFDDFLLADTTPYTSSLKGELARNAQELDWLHGIVAGKSREIAEKSREIAEKSSEIAEKSSEARALSHEVDLLRKHNLHLEMQILEVRHHQDQLRAELNLVYHSVSWKLTQPLRQANAKATWLRAGLTSWIKFKPGTRPRRVASRMIGHCLRWIIRRPRLFRFAKRLLSYNPALEQRLRRLASGDHAVGSNEFVLNSAGAAAMAETTSRIFDRLKQTYDRKRPLQKVS